MLYSGCAMLLHAVLRCAGLQASVLAGVLLLSVLAIIVGAANIWLEYQRLQLTGSRSTGQHCDPLQ